MLHGIAPLIPGGTGEAGGVPGIGGLTYNENYSVPEYDPLATQNLEASSALESQSEQDQLAQTLEQANMEKLQTENSIRMSIMEAIHAIANQAISFSQQFIGDEIAQTKKGLENSGKAV
jgi:hypothetical protein